LALIIIIIIIELIATIYKHFHSKSQNVCLSTSLGWGLSLLNSAYLLLIGLIYFCTKFCRNRSGRLGMHKSQKIDRNPFIYIYIRGRSHTRLLEYSCTLVTCTRVLNLLITVFLIYGYFLLIHVYLILACMYYPISKYQTPIWLITNYNQ
jgi:hypothetical protein